VLKGLDDEALAALANKGLLRRAQKDLEASPPAITAVENGRVRLQAADATVVVPELPSRATCSCPATGICRHILAALLYLRDSPELAACDAPLQQTLLETSESSPTESEASRAAPAAPARAAEFLANLSDAEIQKWAGKPLWRKALEALAANPMVEIDDATVLVVRFLTRNITCRWISAGGLSGMFCSCQAEAVCEHVVTAVLAYQVSLGKRQVLGGEIALRQARGAPRSRGEVFASVGTMLREMVSLGLSRLSSATAQRLTTLAVSAHGVDLPRLERMLKGLADEVQLALRRDAQSNSANLLAQAARIEALRTALAKTPTPPLVGQHRTHYHDVGQITLIGLGAHTWRSKGGYHGVTVCFWDESRKGWSTWSESRPVSQTGFDPASRFRADGPWAGCPSPRQAACSIVRLSQAWRNAQGRISARAATRALVVGPSQPRDVPAAITSWSLLAERAKRLFGGGLGERTENLDLVLLRPKTWGPAFYDPLRQELLRPLVDDRDRIVNLWLPYTPENEQAIDRLERHDPAATHGLLGSLRLVAGQVCVQPISLFVEDKVIQLTLDDSGPKAAKKTRQKVAANAHAAEEEEVLSEEDDEAAPQASAATPLGRLLVTAQAELEALAESGVAVRRNVDLLQSAAKRLETLGLTACSRPLLHLVDTLASSGRLAEPHFRDETAGQLLHAYYLSHLATDYETIDAACSGLQ
jgi:hypothetical protein